MAALKFELWWRKATGTVFLARYRTEAAAIRAAKAHASTRPLPQYYEIRSRLGVKVYGVLPPVTVDLTPPAEIRRTGVTGSTQAFAWDEIPDATLYTFYRNGAPVGTADTESFTDEGLQPLTSYNYQVQGSAAGQSGALSAVFAFTTIENTPPVWTPSSFDLSIGQAFNLDLDEICFDPDRNTVTYSIASGTLPAGITRTANLVSGTPTGVGVSPVTFQASDGFSTSQLAVTFTVTDPDVTAPSVPTNPVAVAAGANVTFTWTASTDASGIKHYRVFRDGNFISTDFFSPFQESGVPEGTYVYSVSAVDNSANSNESAQASAAPLQIILTPPTPDAPRSFTAFGGDGQVSLSWLAGLSGPAPTDYEMNRSSVGLSGPWTGTDLTGANTDLSIVDTGRVNGTTYYYRLRALNGISASDYVYASATPQAASVFNPPYPRTGLRQALGGMTDSNVQNSLSMCARYNVMMVSGSRTETWLNQTYHLGNIPQSVKAKPDYNGNSGTTAPRYIVMCKYNNFTQLNGSVTDFSAKYDVEFTGGASGVGSWFLCEPNMDGVANPTKRPGAGPGGSPGVDGAYATNFSSFTTADHNGLKMSQWHTKAWFHNPSDLPVGDPFNGSNFGVTGTTDYILQTARGLKSGAWDGIFCDDQSMVAGKADQTNGADWNGDGTGDVDISNTGVINTTILRGRVQGFIDTYTAWRARFTEQPLGTLQYAIGNITSIANRVDTWPVAMGGEGFNTTGIIGTMRYDGGLVEEVTNKMRTQGFGTFGATEKDFFSTPAAASGNTISHTGCFGQVWRAEQYCNDPKLVMVGHDLSDQHTNSQKDFRQIFAPGLPNSTIKVGTTNVEISSLSDWRINRFFIVAVTCCTDGYITINQETTTLRQGSRWNTFFPWYDEYVGGTRRDQSGWLGYPLEAKQPNPRAIDGSTAHGCMWRRFDNGIAVLNPFRRNSNTDFTRTIKLPLLPANQQYRRLLAASNGYTTDTNSGPQDTTVNNGFVITKNVDGDSFITLQEMDGVLLEVITV